MKTVSYGNHILHGRFVAAEGTGTMIEVTHVWESDRWQHIAVGGRTVIGADLGVEGDAMYGKPEKIVFAG